MSPVASPGRGPGRTAAPLRLATYFHVHLVSDSTGETLNAMAKAVTARFDGVIPIEHIYALVRSSRQLERVLEETSFRASDLGGQTIAFDGEAVREKVGDLAKNADLSRFIL